MTDLRRTLAWARSRLSADRAPGTSRPLPRTWTLVGVVVAASVGAMVMLAIGFWSWVASGLPRVPDQASMWALNRPPGVTFLDRNGEIAAIRGPYHGRRVGLNDVPEHVWKAFIAIEDRRFWEHGGFDRQAIVRAAVANFTAGDIVQGGSTLSQQLAKNLFLSRDQTIRRKLQEMVLATRIEEKLEKQDILDLYLNTVYLGDQAYGVDAAARRYFGIPSSELSIADCRRPRSSE